MAVFSRDREKEGEREGGERKEEEEEEEEKAVVGVRAVVSNL